MRASFRVLAMLCAAFGCAVALGSVLAMPDRAGPVSEASVGSAAPAQEPVPGPPATGDQIRVVNGHLPGGEGLKNCPNETVRVAVVEGQREIFHHHYCSEYGIGGGRLVTDAQDRHFVLIMHASGRGTHMTSRYLTIYRFTDRLDERAQLRIQAPFGINPTAMLDYRIETPDSGGLVLRGRLTIEGERGSLDTMILPEGTTVVEIDTVADARDEAGEAES